MKTKTKVVLLALCMAALIVVSVLGTMAYLATKTESITNTFTVGNVSIDLDETERVYKMVPGNVLDKDPKVTVNAGSEDCWLFVKIDESENLDDFIDYSVATGWTQLTDEGGNNIEGVYYREVQTSQRAQEFAVLADNKVTVKSGVTKGMLDAITENTKPTLTFTAYAVQKANVSSAFVAWGYTSTAAVETTAPTTTEPTT